jgi:hypothetical protein
MVTCFPHQIHLLGEGIQIIAETAYELHLLVYAVIVYRQNWLFLTLGDLT